MAPEVGERPRQHARRAPERAAGPGGGKVLLRPIAKRIKSFGEKLGKSLRLIAGGNEKERPRFRRLVRSWHRAFAEADLYDLLMDSLEWCRSRVRQFRAQEMLTGLMREVAAHEPPRRHRRLTSPINY